MKSVWISCHCNTHHRFLQNSSTASAPFKAFRKNIGLTLRKLPHQRRAALKLSSLKSTVAPPLLLEGNPGATRSKHQ